MSSRESSPAFGVAPGILFFLGKMVALLDVAALINACGSWGSVTWKVFERVAR